MSLSLSFRFFRPSRGFPYEFNFDSQKYRKVDAKFSS